MDAKAQGLEESSPRAISLQQIIVALNMVSKVTPVPLGARLGAIPRA